MKKLYQDLLYHKNNSLEELLDYLRHQWHTHWHDAIVIVKKNYDRNDYLKMAERYITDYYYRYDPFDQGMTIALDERILIRLDESDAYRLCGVVDRITKADDGCFEIHDYKTNSRLPLHTDLKYDWQLALYSIGVKQRYSTSQTIRLIWHFLKFNQVSCLIWTDEELEKLKSTIIGFIDIIESTDEFPSRPSRLCTWCQFNLICRHWLHS